MRARIAAVLLLVVALGGCTAPPVLEREEIPAEVTCRQFGHVLTVLSNARISHTEGRSSAQELAGASQLAIDLVNEIVGACTAAVAAGADFVKTSTGFSPAGGASVHAVRLMAHTVGDKALVKASGGIRTWDDAVAMVEAGASRLGVSATAAILSGGVASGDY